MSIVDKVNYAEQHIVLVAEDDVPHISVDCMKSVVRIKV